MWILPLSSKRRLAIVLFHTKKPLSLMELERFPEVVKYPQERAGEQVMCWHGSGEGAQEGV